MSPNPYLAPQQPPPHQQDPYGQAPPPSRMPFILAALGAGLASAYWAGLTLLLVFGVSRGSVSPAQIIMPCVLVGLYALRGYQLFKGDPAAAKRVLWLHGLGGIMALIGAFSGGSIVAVLQGIKFVIHVFGAITAYLAQRAFEQNRRAGY